jgi:hypothetical protein
VRDYSFTAVKYNLTRDFFLLLPVNVKILRWLPAFRSRYGTLLAVCAAWFANISSDLLRQSLYDYLVREDLELVARLLE